MAKTKKIRNPTAVVSVLGGANSSRSTERLELRSRLQSRPGPIDRDCATSQHPVVDTEKILNEVMGGGLRVLNRIADSPLVERLGFEERAQSR